VQRGSRDLTNHAAAAAAPRAGTNAPATHLPSSSASNSASSWFKLCAASVSPRRGVSERACVGAGGEEGGTLRQCSGAGTL
jgi:invasion protein IalB